MSFTISLNYGWCDPEPELLPHGVFVASLGLNTQLADSLVSTVGQLRAGVFSFIEINVDSILVDESVAARARLLKENGKIPQLVSGLSSQGNYQLFFSKSFNLPKIQSFQLYFGLIDSLDSGKSNLGIKQQTNSHRVLLIGSQKSIEPAWVDGELLLRWQSNLTNGSGLTSIFTTRLIMKTGLWLDIQVTKRMKDVNISSKISWSNQQILSEIESVRRLAKNISRMRQQKTN